MISTAQCQCHWDYHQDKKKGIKPVKSQTCTYVGGKVCQCHYNNLFTSGIGLSHVCNNFSMGDNASGLKSIWQQCEKLIKIAI